MNLFDKAEEKAKSAPKKKTDKVVVKVDGPDFDKNMIEFVQLKAQADLIKTRMEILESEFKTDCIGIFTEQYKKLGICPESFTITSDSGSSILFVPKDAYIKLDKETATELNDEFNEKDEDGCVIITGENSVTEKITEYALDTKLIQKHGEAISRAIEKITSIPQDEKDRLIVATVNVIVKKGTIEKALTVGKGNIANFISKIRPIFAMNSPKLGADVKTEWVFVNREKNPTEGYNPFNPSGEKK